MLQFKSAKLTFLDAAHHTPIQICYAKKAVLEQGIYSLEFIDQGGNYLTFLKPAKDPYTFHGTIINGGKEAGTIYVTYFENRLQKDFILLGTWKEGTDSYGCIIELKL